MKLKDIFTDSETKIFVVTDQEDDSELKWSIEKTDFDLIPEDENFYFVKSKHISNGKQVDCYLGITTPERVAEIVLKQNKSGKTKIEDIYDQEGSVIPIVASDCFGEYTLYYSTENPQIGIDILKEGLTKATNKNVVAEDLGYILRDEGRLIEAIEAFKISEEFGPSSEFIYGELAGLYNELGQTDEALKYEEKFKNNG